jgi:putative cardiolipin synthase
MRRIAASRQDKLANQRHCSLQVIVALLVLAGCTILPPAPPVPAQISLDPATSGDLVNIYREAVLTLPENESAFLRLSSNEAALNWRLELIDRATTSIDLQYFIWNNDVAANLLFLRLLDAADRGVRVRLMVDDIFLIGRDRDLAILDDHPYLNIKIYNPGRIRDSTLGGLGEFLLNFRQLNRRMHNKMLVADNRIGIIGGRNIGNAYFGLDEKYNFRDLDVLVIGPVIEEISHAFDEYWNHEMAYPVGAIPHEASVERIERLRQDAEKYVQAHLGELAAFRAERPVASEKIERLVAQMQSGEAHFLQDDPVSVDDEEMRVVDMLRFISGRINEEMLIITPYFIPRPSMLEGLADLTSRGVRVRILTGSLASNNHTVAHAHYRKYRRRILEAGIELYEYRHLPSPRQRGLADTPPVVSNFISLHTKAIVTDQRMCFVGSLNLDPRAIEINTENGLYIESEQFCGELSEQGERMMASANSWRVYLDEKDRIRWISAEGIRTSQPARNTWQRVQDFFYRWIPIEGQL